MVGSAASFFLSASLNRGSAPGIHRAALIGDHLEIQRVLAQLDEHEVVTGVEALGGELALPTSPSRSFAAPPEMK